MDMARALGGRLVVVVGATVSPALAPAQAPTLPDPVPPGGLSGAWPLGIIVLLVALVAVLGAWLERRGRRTAGGPPRGGG
jgi:hypothetical protein